MMSKARRRESAQDAQFSRLVKLIFKKNVSLNLNITFSNITIILFFFYLSIRFNINIKSCINHKQYKSCALRQI